MARERAWIVYPEGDFDREAIIVEATTQGKAVEKCWDEQLMTYRKDWGEVGPKMLCAVPFDVNEVKVYRHSSRATDITEEYFSDD